MNSQRHEWFMYYYGVGRASHFCFSSSTVWQFRGQVKYCYKLFSSSMLCRRKTNRKTNNEPIAIRFNHHLQPSSSTLIFNFIFISPSPAPLVNFQRIEDTFPKHLLHILFFIRYHPVPSHVRTRNNHLHKLQIPSQSPSSATKVR